MLIKKPRKWKYELLIAEVVAIVMLFFLGASLASAQTIFESVSFASTTDGIDEFTLNTSMSAPFIWDAFYPGHPRYAPIATGTMTNLVTPFRWIPFGAFDGSSSHRLQLVRYNGGANPVDCYSDYFIPDQIASSGVPVLYDFDFSGTECDIYQQNPYDDPPGFYQSPDWQWYVRDVPATSGAIQTRTLPSGSGDRPILIYGTEGPTNPDLLVAVDPAVTTPPITFQTRFTDAQAQGNSSTSISVDIDYQLNTSEYTANTRPDYITIQFIKDGLFSDQQVAVANKLILPLTDGDHSTIVPVNHAFEDGDYFAYIHFWNINTNSITFEQTGVVISFEVVGGVVQNALIEQITDGLTLDEDQLYEDCSISNLDGCFKNALIYVFVPEPDAFDKFTTIYENIENKPPFGYVTAVKNALAGITDGATPAFAFGDIPFQTTIFDPFKAILAIGLWVLYALFFMGRVNKLDI